MPPETPPDDHPNRPALSPTALSLADAAKAHRELESRKTTGSTILLP